MHKDDIIISRSALMKGLVEGLEEIGGKPVIFWAETATPVSQKLEIELVPRSKRISKT